MSVWCNKLRERLQTLTQCDSYLEPDPQTGLPHMVENEGNREAPLQNPGQEPPQSDMQNPEGTAAAVAQRQQQAQAAKQQRETAESLALLREAVLRLTQHAVRDAPITAPTSRLTKLGPEDDVEAYLEVFERTAQRES